MTVKEMRTIAKELGIKNANKMNKETLEQLIREATEQKAADEQSDFESAKTSVEETATEAAEETTTKTKTTKKTSKSPKVLTVVAFTGMWLGEFEVVKETAKYVSVQTKTSVLRFNKETGMQVDAKKPRFANRIMVTA